jgi:hypothetical protein
MGSSRGEHLLDGSFQRGADKQVVDQPFLRSLNHKVRQPFSIAQQHDAGPSASVPLLSKGLPRAKVQVLHLQPGPQVGELCDEIPPGRGLLGVGPELRNQDATDIAVNLISKPSMPRGIPASSFKRPEKAACVWRTLAGATSRRIQGRTPTPPAPNLPAGRFALQCRRYGIRHARSS